MTVTELDSDTCSPPLLDAELEPIAQGLVGSAHALIASAALYSPPSEFLERMEKLRRVLRYLDSYPDASPDEEITTYVKGICVQSMSRQSHQLYKGGRVLAVAFAVFSVRHATPFSGEHGGYFVEQFGAALQHREEQPQKLVQLIAFEAALKSANIWASRYLEALRYAPPLYREKIMPQRLDISVRLDMILPHLMEAARQAHAAFVEYLSLLRMRASPSMYEAVAGLDAALKQDMKIENNVAILARTIKNTTEVVFDQPQDQPTETSRCAWLMANYLNETGNMQNTYEILKASSCAHTACHWAGMYLMAR